MKKYQKIIYLGFLAIIVSGCSTVNNPLVTEIDTKLKSPQNIKAISDYVTVGLEWESPKDLNIIGYNIYRTTTGEEPTKVGKVDSRYGSHFFDKGLKLNQQYEYKIVSISQDNKESVGTKLKVQTLPKFDSVLWSEGISLLPKEAKIVWRPHEYPAIKDYIILRSIPSKSNSWEEIAVVDGRLSAEYIDRNLEDGRLYQYRIVSRTFDGALSNPTNIISINTRGIPRDIENLRASNNLPKKIEVRYDYSGDISHYNIYASSSVDGTYSVVARTNDTIFVDNTNEDGVTRFYKVTAVDKFGLESPLQNSPVLGSSKSKPDKPIILSTNCISTGCLIKWFSDKGVSFIAKKSKYINPVSTEDTVIKNINTKELQDNQIEPNIKYKYHIIAVDKDGVTSDESEAVEVYIKR